MLIVNDKQPYKTLKEFVDDAKKRPDALIFSSSGLYGALHLPMALFMKSAGIKLRHLPTAGGGPALTALMGNNSQALVSSIAAASGQLKAGKARALASFGAKRSPALSGRADHEGARPRHRVLSLGRPVRAQGNAGADHHQAARRDQDRRSRTDQFKQAMTNLGQEVAYLDQAEFRTFWDADAKRVEEAVRIVGKVDG